MARLLPSICTALCIPVLAAILVDFLIDDVIDPEGFSLPEPPKFRGVLETNERLTSAYKLFEGQIAGPESLVINGDHIYAGTSDGKVIDIYKDEIKILATFGKPPCGSFKDEPTCGRPLGMRMNEDGDLIVVDAYLGLFRVNVGTGEFQQLYSSTKKINGKQPMFLNDIDIASDGTIFMTDSSYKWSRRYNRLLIMENRPDGRLLKYTPKTGEVEVVVDGLYFPNGLQLSDDESYLLISETSRCRIQRYYLSGEKTGELEIFADNLPGLPDNIRPSRNRGYWVGLAMVRHPDKLVFFDWLIEWPWIRKITAKILSQDQIAKLGIKPYGLIIELDGSGVLRKSLHDPTGQIFVSEVNEVDGGALYLGSYYSPFIAKVELPKRL